MAPAPAAGVTPAVVTGPSIAADANGGRPPD
jgi:hypothetical protein